MTMFTSDPLLGILRALLYFLMGVMAFVAFVLVLATPIAIIFQGNILAELVQDGKGDLGGEFIAAITFILLAVAGLLSMGFYFLLLLLRMTDTVRDGDPFIPENADRLSRMGWVTVIAHIWAIVISIPATWLAEIAQDVGEDARVDIDVGGGLMMILVLFILARVFRKGTEMREDLEGTV